MQVKNQFAPNRSDVVRLRSLAPFLLAILFLLIFLKTNERLIGASGLPKSRNTQARVIQQEEGVKLRVRNQVDTTNSPSTQDRGSLTLPKALVGHWISEKSKTHMYYGQGKFISVYSGKAHQGTYTVEEVDEKKGRMLIRITPLHLRILTFSANKNEMSDIVEVAGIRATEEEAIRWKYVDNSEQPSSEILRGTEDEEPVVEVTTAVEEPGPEFIIGDTRTKVFYWRGCPDYEKLPLQRRVYFKTKRDAQRAGYRTAKNCP